jgi:hypothetical protein
MNRALSYSGLIGVVVLVLSAACASEETNAQSSSAGGGGASSQASGPTSTSSGSGGGAATGTGGAGQGGAGGAGGAGQGGGGGAGGGQGALAPSITSMDMYIDCMPIVGPDPVHGSFTASYNNSAGASFSDATITSAKLVFDAGKEWTFKVAPNTSGMVGPGMTTMSAHVKQSDSGSGTVAPCGYCNGVWTLEVTWDTGGQSVTDTLGPNPVQCVF